ncbi:hypothetical protein B9Z55_013102 [Caenorhabditis nigoni]|uniref:Uncharacterized protein n=1 Tax=Caenorhabditis nigoni TaxID=1611254 RepID=A0A2G5U077_9PELO|nr:hypothetical protein B9Z55_013102 [Caenorhabditis nigoni]
MSDEPAAKRMKNNDEFPNLRADVADAVKEKLIELDTIQHQLDIMSEKAAEEILRVEQTFNKKRVPIYEKRKALTTKIDNFWQTAFLNHHLLSTAIPEEQEDLLSALRDLEVQEFDDLRSGFKIIMTFDKNDYFENDIITKSYHLQSETPSTEITEIQWKDNKKPTLPDDDAASITFLEWLSYAAPPDSDEIAEVIKDDLFINPLQYYVMPDMQEVDEDDIEGFLNEERGLDENGKPINKRGGGGSPKLELEMEADVEEEEMDEDESEGEDEEEEEGEGDAGAIADGEEDGDDEEEEEDDEEEEGQGEEAGEEEEEAAQAEA